MRILFSLVGSILLGSAVVIAGLYGNITVAKPDNNNIPGASDTNGCGPSGNQPKKCASVPEPSSLILVSLIGIFMSRMRRITKVVRPGM